MPLVAGAQRITVDGRFAPAQTLTGPNYAITASLGKQVGSNLFHSFGQFGLATGESAAFSGPATISNVIGRVTGGNASSIDGRVQSTIAGANLYLINPSGIVFGPNATVNVSGSFHASTADYLKMSDGAKFQATNPDSGTLSGAPPAAFGFLTARPAAIAVNGSTLGPVPGTLGLVAGPVSITSATLSAPAGTIHVTGAAGIGEVPVDPRNTPALTAAGFGPVDIKGGSKLNVSDPSGLGSGGSVFIRSGALTINASEINADNYRAGPGGQIALRADGQIALANGASVHAGGVGVGRGGSVMATTEASNIDLDNSSINADTKGAGNAGDVSVRAAALNIFNNGVISSGTSGSGNGGTVSVTVAGQLSIAGKPDGSLTGIASDAGPSSTGNAGNVVVSAGTLKLVSNGEISSTTFAFGNAGTVSVTVGDQLNIDGTSANSSFLTGIAAETEVGSFGNAGSVQVNVGSLLIANSGTISASTSGSGAAGNIVAQIGGMLAISGDGSETTSTGIFATPGLLAEKNNGSTTITAGSLSIVNGGQISTSTFGSAPAGNITLNVTGDLQATNGSSSQVTGVLASTVGNLAIIFGGGNAGRVSVDVGGRLSLDGGATGIAAIAADSLAATGTAET
jgi:filamentous hemagglutinin family protein